jgi:hypothetical protein
MTGVSRGIIIGNRMEDWMETRSAVPCPGRQPARRSRAVYTPVACQGFIRWRLLAILRNSPRPVVSAIAFARSGRCSAASRAIPPCRVLQLSVTLADWVASPSHCHALQCLNPDALPSPACRSDGRVGTIRGSDMGPAVRTVVRGRSAKEAKGTSDRRPAGRRRRGPKKR